MKSIRKTKIICTLGPVTQTEEMLRSMMLEGMDVARFNFSHGTHEDKLNTLNMVKKVREELGLYVATLLDTRGPEIRIGLFEDGKIELEEGQMFTLTVDDKTGNKEMVSVNYPDLVNDVTEGSKILIDDGLIEMDVVKVSGSEILCRVLNSGVISDRKGVNVPNVHLSMPFVSKKDRDDILFGIKHGFDFIAASFVRSAKDVLEIRKILKENDGESIRIISKIENMKGVDNIDEIIKASDGVMVARGDLGVEIPFEEVPAIQKKIIRKVYGQGKVVITATQMLDSMMKNPRPTRAEATDVANAIYDGTSSIMLSGETAAGNYPLEAIRTMVKIAISTEKDINYAERFKQNKNIYKSSITNAISHATCTTAIDVNSSAIITVTKSGSTARSISKYRPVSPIIGCCMDERVCRQLNLSWGVVPILVDECTDTDQLFDEAVEMAEKNGIVKAGELVVITAGVPLGVTGTTNLMKVLMAGKVLVKGTRISGGKATANLCVCKNEKELIDNFKPGDIIVISDTSNNVIEQIKEAAGLITENTDVDSHAATAGLSLDLPVIIGAKNATKILKSGSVVTIDAEYGMVRSS